MRSQTGIGNCLLEYYAPLVYTARDLSKKYRANGRSNGRTKISATRFEELKQYAEQTDKTVEQFVDTALVEFLEDQQGR